MSEPGSIRLPAVWKVLEHPDVHARISRLGHGVALDAVRTVQAQARERARRGEAVDDSVEAQASQVAALLDADQPALCPVINATGVLIHTGLGRAPLGEAVARHVAEVVRGYCCLELDLETGERGRRDQSVARLLRVITGAEAATVVNNNAAATLLTLRALAAAREVVVSRGQLVEIGGSFRLPEVFEASGARLREVGTTNKTRLSDYERAIGPETAVLMRVHTSNFRIEGFCESVPIGALAGLAHARGLICLDDIGSGALRGGCPPQIGDEPTIADSLAAGADLVLCSGDKLLGGPQCGLILGRAELMSRIKSDPLMRALRVDKMTLAALECVLRDARRDSEDPNRSNLLWKLTATPPDALRERALRLAERLRAHSRWNADAVETQAYLGGGSAPALPLTSWALQLRPPFPESDRDVASFARALRLGRPPIVGRIHDDVLWLDLRAVLPEQDDALFQALFAAIQARTQTHA